MKSQLFIGILITAVTASAQSVDPLTFGLEGPVKSVSGVVINNPFELTVSLEFDTDGYLTGYVYNGVWQKLSVSSGTISRYSDVDNGVPIRKLFIDPYDENQATVPLSEFKYDSARRLIGYVITENMDVGADTRLIRNADGDVVKEEINITEWNGAKDRTDKSRKVKTYKITSRDRWGNWTERLWKCGSQSGVDRRTFIYYSDKDARFGIEYELKRYLNDISKRRQCLASYIGGLADGYMAQPEDIRGGNVPVIYSDCYMSFEEFVSVSGGKAKAKVFVGKGTKEYNFPTMTYYDVEMLREGLSWKISNMTCAYSEDYRREHPEIGDKKVYDMLNELE